jgi:Tfp pilus assembly protein PilN
MIKINLLPQRKVKRATDPGSNAIFIGAGVLVAAAAAVFFLVDRPRRSKLAEIEALNTQLDTDIADKQKQLARKGNVPSYDEIVKLVQSSEEQAASINRLLSAKVVPANLLQELGDILTQTHQPTITEAMNAQMQKIPDKRFDQAWDPSHVWLQSFTDTDGTFKMDGGAQLESDVTQLSKRLAASVYFLDVSPSNAELLADASTGTPYYHFTITGKVAY